MITLLYVLVVYALITYSVAFAAYYRVGRGSVSLILMVALAPITVPLSLLLSIADIFFTS